MAGPQIRKVRKSVRHSWVLRDTLILAGSWRAIDKVGRPGQPHLRASYPKQTNKQNADCVLLYYCSVITTLG